SATFVRIDDENTLLIRDILDLLNTRAWRIAVPLANVDAHGTILPFAVIELLQPAIQFGIASPLEADQVTVAVRTRRLQIRVADHAAVADKNDPAKVEAVDQVAEDLLHRGYVQTVAFPDVMGNRPARDHHQANHHLHVLRFAVTAVAIMGVGRTRSFKVCAGDVVQHQVRTQTEQVTQAIVELHLQALLGGAQAI